MSGDYERFMARVDDAAGPDACHIWTGSRSSKGYGWFWVTSDKRRVTATRWILGFLRGTPLGPDEYALHRCDNPPCVNPTHLYVGDQIQNMRDCAERGRAWNPTARANAARTHCPYGHEYGGDNLFRRSDGARSCRACDRVRAGVRYAARRSARPVQLAADDPRHGTRTGYGLYACRCEPCRNANRTYARQRRAVLSSAGES